MFQNYETIYNDSITNPGDFWSKNGHLLTWTKPWTDTINDSHPPFTKWYVGGELNACYNAVDRHVEAGNGAKPALIHESPQLQTTTITTYAQLQQDVAKMAGALSHIGVTKGDRVIIYFPVMPEACISMLACARLGAIHSFVFGGFAPCELSCRIDYCQPKVILAPNSALENTKIVNYLANLVEALALAKHQPLKCIILERPGICPSHLPDAGMYLDWGRVMATARPHPCVPVEANHPLYLLYTSGTTGQPKGVVRPTGGHLVSLAWSMEAAYGMKAGDVWWATSDFGWVVGHSYMCYAPLLCCLTSVLYEGKPTTTPDAWQYFRLIEKHRINGMFTVPTVLRILSQSLNCTGVKNKHDLGSLRNIFVGGEHCDLTTKLWAEKFFKTPVLNNWWQTETGSPMTATCVGLGVTHQPGLSTGVPFPGYKFEIRGKDGGCCQPWDMGRVLVKLPLPPGTFANLYKNETMYLELYFRKYPGYYDTKDAGFIDDKGNMYIVSRVDDVINVAGHRISTLSLENVILEHLDVAEACVISVPDPIKHEVPFCLFVPKNDEVDVEVVREELVNMVRRSVGPVAAFKLAEPIRALPQTRSGKICRKAMSNIARDRFAKVNPMVTDPSIFEDVRIIFEKYNFVNDGCSLKDAELVD